MRISTEAPSGRKGEHIMGLFGPSGGTGGNYSNPGPTVPAIAYIVVYAGEYVNAIELHDPGDLNTQVYGNTGTGQVAARIDFQPNETLIGIQGRCGEFVDSIRFYTSARIIPEPPLPAFGGSGGGQAYQYMLDRGGSIAGFFGNTGDWINSIGVFT